MAFFERPAINSLGRDFIVISVDRLSGLYYQFSPTLSVFYGTLSVRPISYWTNKV